ncbi:hypothetical protein IQ06DRAFT_341323 [Phaeosphaeriaceae sp. SRC1lsM3a]|nr:hypothetical protein IQ06DRAFT_341323 [Stagonospora sp. SRC1lsM3a]
MSSQKKLPVLPALCPAISGVPSRRHLVVIARGEKHHMDLLAFILEMMKGVKDIGEGVVTECSLGLIKNKLQVVDQAIDELDHHTSVEAKAEIVVRLEALKAGRERASLLLKIRK